MFKKLSCFLAAFFIILSNHGFATDNKKERPIDRLIRSYGRADIEFPLLKSITLAQWMIESGWGKSRLATKAYNFGGIKYTNRLSVETKRYGSYCKFKNPSEFIRGYWDLLESERYEGWREAAEKGPNDFLKFIVSKGYVGKGKTKQSRYIQNVQKTVPKARELLEQSVPLKLYIPKRNQSVVTSTD